MRVLGIETSGLRGSVALVEDDRILVSHSHEAENRHAEETLGLIERALSDVGWSKTSLDRVAASRGPGSFTGVRVGLALAEGLGLGLGVTTLGVGSLQAAALAESVDPSGRWLAGSTEECRAVLRDARREEFFLAAYDGLGNELLAPLAIPQLGAEAEVARRLAHYPGYRLLRTEPDARALALLAGFLEPSQHPLTPLYVRDAGATPQHLPPSPLNAPRSR